MRSFRWHLTVGRKWEYTVPAFYKFSGSPPQFASFNHEDTPEPGKAERGRHLNAQYQCYRLSTVVLGLAYSDDSGLLPIFLLAYKLHNSHSEPDKAHRTELELSRIYIF
jgi:hypothetical protein